MVTANFHTGSRVFLLGIVLELPNTGLHINFGGFLLREKPHKIFKTHFFYYFLGIALDLIALWPDRDFFS
jgi:hypothetical protein